MGEWKDELETDFLYDKVLSLIDETKEQIDNHLREIKKAKEARGVVKEVLTRLASDIEAIFDTVEFFHEYINPDDEDIY